jgi:hypothetical protein
VKRLALISTAAVLLLMGFTAPAGAYQNQQDQQQNRQKQSAKPKQQQGQQRQQQGRKPQAQPRQQQQRQTQRQPVQQRQQQTKGRQGRPQQARPQPQQQQRQEARQQQGAWQGRRAHNWQSEHRTWHQRGGYHGYRIPSDRYNGYFGPDHFFRIYSYPVMIVGGYPRFQYDGFWFSLVDPWPQSWSNNWYENDDVYIVYSGGGYYLYNRSYPGYAIAVNVYLN